jgi:hypothetical protein
MSPVTDNPLRVASITAQSFTAASLSTLGITCGTVLGLVHSPLVKAPPADHPVYALIGKVAANWSHLEHTLDLIIWDLTGIVPEKGACITAQMMGATNRYRTIISLLKQRATPAFDKLAEATDKLMNRSYGSQEERNRIIHDAWYVYEDQTAQFRAMPPKDQRFGVCSVDVQKIEKTLDSTKDLVARAGTLWRDIHTEIGSSAS